MRRRSRARAIALASSYVCYVFSPLLFLPSVAEFAVQDAYVLKLEEKEYSLLTWSVSTINVSAAVSKAV